MALLTRTQLALAGVDPAFVGADVAGDEFPVDTRTIFTIRNGGGAPITVTVASQLPAGAGYAPEDLDVIVAAGGEEEIVFQPARPFTDVDGRAQVTYSAVTTVTVAARRA